MSNCKITTDYVKDSDPYEIIHDSCFLHWDDSNDNKDYSIWKGVAAEGTVTIVVRKKVNYHSIELEDITITKKSNHITLYAQPKDILSEFNKYLGNIYD